MDWCSVDSQADAVLTCCGKNKKSEGKTVDLQVHLNPRHKMDGLPKLWYGFMSWEDPSDAPVSLLQLLHKAEDKHLLMLLRATEQRLKGSERSWKSGYFQI